MMRVSSSVRGGWRRFSDGGPEAPASNRARSTRLVAVEALGRTGRGVVQRRRIRRLRPPSDAVMMGVGSGVRGGWRRFPDGGREAPASNRAGSTRLVAVEAPLELATKREEFAIQFPF